MIGNSLFAGAENGVYLTTDYGQSWNSAGSFNNYVSGLAWNSSYLFAADAYGVWRRSLSDFGISSVSQTTAATPSEIQIYPNPFSQSTQITFSSITAGYAEVSIVNTLGVEVARLFSGELDAGEHNFMWGNPTGLPDEVYECVVRMNGLVDDRSSTVQTLPVVLMK